MSDRIALSASCVHPALSMAKLEGNQIDEQMDSAREKADQAKDAATTGMWLGTVAGVVSMGAGAASGAAMAQSDHAESASGPLGGLARMVPTGGLHASLEIDIHRDASSKKAEEDRSQSSTAKDHRSQMRDAITDLLQKLAQMNDSSKVLR